MKKHVVILGNYEATRGLFDWKRTDCDIWALNEMLSQSNPKERWIERADAIFQLHDAAIWRNPGNRTDPGHYEWLRTQTEVPVYMQKHYDDVPMSVEYPLEDIKTFLLADFNIKDVFSSTLAYCMALAIRKGYESIETYGVELGTDTEYRHQREGFTFWCGVAVGNGIRTAIHTTALMHAPLYGYQGEVTLPYEVFIDRIKELEPHAAEAKRAFDEARKPANAAINALKAEVSEENVNSLIEAANVLVTTSVQYGMIEGGRQQNERYVKKADVMKEASGGSFVFSRQEFESSRVSLTAEHHRLILRAQSDATRVSLMVQSIFNTNSKSRRLKRITQLAQTINEWVHTSSEAAMMAGGLAEDMNYMQRLDAGIRAAGGEKSIEPMLQAAL